MAIVRFKRLSEDAILPAYMSSGAAGFDLWTVSGGVIGPGEWQNVPTGWAVEIQEGYEMQIRPRSGLAVRNGVTVLNAPGTIDSDYRGEVGVILMNHSSVPFTYERGDRVAQGVVVKAEQATLVEARDLSATERGGRGFGSTGS